jgi:beta-glucanase (GH16 family)
VLASLALAGLVLATVAQAQECPTLVWQDEFDGSELDTTKWEPMVGDGCDLGICGWGNNELQHYQAANATVSGGVLKIEARKEKVGGKEYTSARLRTKGRGDFTFGRMEARIRLTQGQGIWPAFWMLPTDEVHGGWPRSGEIDIMENVGHETATVHGTVHFGPAFPDNQFVGASYELQGGAFADGFHTFAVEREPGEIRWYVDDVLYSTKTQADTAPHAWPFDERFHFLLNVAVGGNWPGSPDETTVLPQVMEVDYVRVYDGNLSTPWAAADCP